MSNHYSTVTRTEPSGDLYNAVCYKTPKVAERHMEREAIMLQQNNSGYIERINDRVMEVLKDTDTKRFSVKVVLCRSEYCKVFSGLVKTHR